MLSRVIFSGVSILAADNETIAMKRIAPESLVNTQVAGLAFGPHVAVLQGGGYVVTWGLTDSGGVTHIELQRFDDNGQPRGSEVTIANGSRGSPVDNLVSATDLTGLSSGDFLVGFANSFPSLFAGVDYSVDIRRYHPDGTQAAIIPVGDSHNADIALASSKATGGYAAAWEHATAAGQSPFLIELRIFDASNNPVTGVIPVSSGHTSNAVNPTLDWLTNGNLVVAYTNVQTEHVNAWVFDPNGTVIGGEIDVGSATPSGPDTSPDVVALASGNFAVVWEEGGGNNSSIHGRIFSANGTALTSDFAINTTTDTFAQSPDATALTDGTFYVTWDGGNIFSQVIDGAGHRVGSEVVVNRFFGIPEISPDATVLNGKLLNVFVDGSHQYTNSNGQTDPDRGVASQTLDPNASEFAHTSSWTDQQHGTQLWSVGDFNGDHRDDILRYDPGVSGAEVFTSNGMNFSGGASWTPAGNDSQGWYVGDFNGDGLSDILRYNAGVSGAEVLLSNGSSFANPVSWTPAGNDSQGWYVGDFNGDGRDDIFRFNAGVSGAEVLLSTGSSFANPVSWTPAGNDSQGWYVGDFNGDGRDDIFRYHAGVSGAEVLLSTGSSFANPVSWTPAGNEGFWYVGDYNGDGRADIFRHHTGVSGAEVFLSTGTSFAANGSWTADDYGSDGWYRGDFNGDHHTDIFRVLPGVSGADMFINI